MDWHSIHPVWWLWSPYVFTLFSRLFNNLNDAIWNILLLRRLVLMLLLSSSRCSGTTRVRKLLNQNPLRWANQFTSLASFGLDCYDSSNVWFYHVETFFSCISCLFERLVLYARRDFQQGTFPNIRPNPTARYANLQVGGVRPQSFPLAQSRLLP